MCFSSVNKNKLGSKYIIVAKVFCLSLVQTDSLSIVLPPKQNTELLSNVSVKKSTPPRNVFITGKAFLISYRNKNHFLSQSQNTA